MAIVVTTHKLEWVVSHSDYVAVLQKGRLTGFGEVQDLLRAVQPLNQVTLFWKKNTIPHFDEVI